MSESEKLLIDWANKAIEYGVQNVPVVVQQYITWWYWMHLISMCIGIVFILIAIYTIRWEWKQEYAWNPDERVGAGFSWAISIVGAIFGSGMTIYNGMNLVKVKVAPAAYIIDKLMGS